MFSLDERNFILQDTTHLIQRSRYQRGSLCQDQSSNRTTRRPPDHRKEMQTAVVWSYLPFIRSGILARHSERGKKTRQTERQVPRQHQGMDRPGLRQVPEGSLKQVKMEETGCEVICATQTTLPVKGYVCVCAFVCVFVCVYVCVHARVHAFPKRENE